MPGHRFQDRAGTAPPGEEGEWLELSVEVDPEAVESLSEAFDRWGQGVAIEQPVESSRDGEVVSVPPGAPVRVITYVPLADPAAPARRQQLARAVWALGRLRSVGPLRERTLREEEWATAWKEHFQVHRVGGRTVVVPSWRRAEYQPSPQDVAVLLDPGMAFGTGLHPTTRLCLEELELEVADGEAVLDLGAGSGILAIAAAKLGAGQVDAVELDPVAARVCRENVVTNGVERQVHVFEGSLDTPGVARGPFDLAVANITLRVLLELHRPLAGRLRPGGRAIFSGVLEERADDLLSALRDAGWSLVRRRFEQDWCTIVARRP